MGDGGVGEGGEELPHYLMICEQWPRWTGMKAVGEYGKACGCRFKVTAFETSLSAARATVMNAGAAPIYADAHVAVNGTRSTETLKGLLPGKSRRLNLASGESSQN